MTLRDIIIEGLKAAGYDGLQNEECGCGLDDFAPCDEPSYRCEPAYRRKCEDCPILDAEDEDGCQLDQTDGCWHVEKLEAPCAI
jgi:hypothetical protein